MHLDRYVFENVHRGTANCRSSDIGFYRFNSIWADSVYPVNPHGHSLSLDIQPKVAKVYVFLYAIRTHFL